MKKVFVLSLLSLMVLPLVASADYGNMMDGDGMMGSGMWGGGWLMGLLCLVYFAIGSFIFSLIFWLVHNWITKK